MNKNRGKFYQMVIAVDNDGVWDWKMDISDRYRQLYYLKQQQDRFSVKNNTLNVWMVNQDYLKTLVDGGIKVAGSGYVLALSLTGGDRASKEFTNCYYNLTSDKKPTYYVGQQHIHMLEKYLKLHALACGVEDDEKIRWRPPHFGEVELSTLQDYYSNDKSNFIVVDSALYYLRPYSMGLENLYRKCVELAGGDYALAVATAGDKKTVELHKKAFERGVFKQRKNSQYYGVVFENYLNKNQQLFDTEVAI